MLERLIGPLTWLALFGFASGALYKIISMALMARRERVVFPTMSAKYGLRSVAHWLMPFGSTNMRRHPLLTMVSFAFHICLLFTPLLVMGHGVLWQEAWGVSWWSLPPALADTMTLVVILGGLAFLLRRLASPEVRKVSDRSDYLLLLLVVSPFLTAFLAHQQWLPYKAMLVLHVITGTAWLIAIPFTRLSHMLWFGFSRSYMGSEFGAVRNARDW